MQKVASWMGPFIGTVSTVLLMAGCLGSPAPEREPAAGELRFRNWWNYYQRGADRLREGEVQAAREDFERCLGLRPGAKYGYARDKWRVRTYGVHVLEGYYPNRELGICLFLLGDTAGAEKYLDRSLQQQPSGRAKHYMNRVRWTRLEAARVAPPRLEWAASEDTAWTHARTLTIQGRAVGEGYIRDLLVNGEPEFIELAEPALDFARTIPLEPGPNVIRVQARDLLGREAARTLRVIADWRGPELLIRSIEREADGWRARGVCLDDDRIESATLLHNASPTLLVRPTAPRPRVELDVRIAAGRPAWFEARDRAGNTLRVDLAHLVRTLLARSPVRLAAMDSAAPAQAGSEARDGIRPEIVVNGPLVATVFRDAHYLDGHIDDRGGLAGITLNGRELLPAEERGALSYAFSQRLPLAPGENRFELAAEDRAGNRSVKKLALTRATPPALDRRWRLTLGLPPPLGEPPLAAHLGRHLQAAFEEEPVRFNLRAGTAAWSVLPPAPRTGSVDLAPYLEAARALHAEVLAVCSMVREGAGHSIYARVVYPGDGHILFVEDVYSEEIEENFPFYVAGLAAKIGRRFPLFRATVARAARGQFVLDKGAADGVRVKARVLVAAPPEGAVRMAGDAPVELRVVRADRARGIAEPVAPTARDVVQEGDVVFAR